MLIRQIWDVFVLALCIYAFAVAFIVINANPTRSLNRFFSCFLAILGTALFTQVLAMNFKPGLPYLRAANSLAGFLIVVAILINDAVLHPISPLIVRATRNFVFLTLAFAIAIHPLAPSWYPNHSGTYPDIEFACYLALRWLLSLYLAVRAVTGLRRAPPERRFDAQIFAVLAFSFLAEMTAMLVVVFFMNHQATHWINAVFALYFPIAAWMMTTPRLFSICEFSHASARLFVSLVIPCVATWFLLRFSVSLPAPFFAIILATAIYLASVLGHHIAHNFVKPLENSAWDETKASVTKLIADEWSEERLTGRFCSLVSSLTEQARVEVAFVDSPTKNDLSQNRRLLLTEASKRGWLTLASTHRIVAENHARTLQDAFLAEDLALVLVSGNEGNLCVLFVGHISSLKVMTHRVVVFISELQTIFQIGRERIFLARKAVHNDRLATLGFIASQVSHDARNRLDSIRAALDLLDQGKEDLLSGEHRSLLLKELDAFLLDFNISLDMARIDDPRIVPCLPHSVLDDVIRVFTPYASSFGILIETAYSHESRMVSADIRLLRQTLFNLFRNSAEALKEVRNPRIFISTSIADDTLLIDIEDNGPGVGSDVYDRLFIEFNTTKASGTGLGLSLCRAAMAMMKGAICYVTPRGEQHACFRLTIPLVASMSPEPLLSREVTLPLLRASVRP